jgi:hypothetical protein
MGIYLTQPHYDYRNSECWSRKKSEDALFCHSGPDFHRDKLQPGDRREAE